MGKNLFKIYVVLCFGMLFFMGNAVAQTFYNLPDCLNNWKIPEWSESKSNYSSPILAVDENFSYKGITTVSLFKKYFL